MGEEGICFGEQNAGPEKGTVWAGWVYKETLTPAPISDVWGRLNLQKYDEVVSPVIDMGNSDSKYLSVAINNYQLGYGAFSLQWRGRSTIFNKQDNEVVGPAWEGNMPGSRDWRYMQLKIIAL